MANNNDLFGILQAKDKLDGTSYLMKHVLVAKKLWNIMVDADQRLASPTSKVYYHKYRFFFKYNGFTLPT